MVHFGTPLSAKTDIKMDPVLGPFLDNVFLDFGGPFRGPKSTINQHVASK